jgi:hypothetical protein
MAIPNVTVEFGFDLTDSPVGPFFQLNDSTKGRLDNTEYRLAGTLFIDVTDRVRDFSTQRGRTALLARNPAGQIEISLNNHDRAFDPLYPDSPFVGNIVPEREVRVKSNDIVIFRGFIDDWNLSYSNGGDSLVDVSASDAITKFNNMYLAEETPPEESASDRINRILNSDAVQWPEAFRDIEGNSQLMSPNLIEEGKSALEYLQNIALSEPGEFFISREGNVRFTNRRNAPTQDNVVEFGAGGIPFDNVGVVYGSEQLFNSIRITRESGGTVVANDQKSIGEYGLRTLEIADMQIASDEAMTEIAVQYASQYSKPEYRFDQFDVYLHKLDPATQSTLLSLDLESVVKVEFTPNQIGDPIVQYGRIIRLEHVANVDFYGMTFGLSELFYTPLVLDDAVFGKLDVGTLSW